MTWDKDEPAISAKYQAGKLAKQEKRKETCQGSQEDNTGLPFNIFVFNEDAVF
jgi:hypothetical protein